MKGSETSVSSSLGQKNLRMISRLLCAKIRVVIITSLRYLGHTNKVTISQKMTLINLNHAVDY